MPWKSRWFGAGKMEWCPSKRPQGKDAAHLCKIDLYVVSYKPRDLRPPSMCSDIALAADIGVERGVCTRSIWSRTTGTRVTLMEGASQNIVGAADGATLTQIPLLTYASLLAGAPKYWSVQYRAQVSFNTRNQRSSVQHCAPSPPSPFPGYGVPSPVSVGPFGRSPAQNSSASPTSPALTGLHGD